MTEYRASCGCVNSHFILRFLHSHKAFYVCCILGAHEDLPARQVFFQFTADLGNVAGNDYVAGGNLVFQTHILHEFRDGSAENFPAAQAVSTLIPSQSGTTSQPLVPLFSISPETVK